MTKMELYKLCHDLYESRGGKYKINVGTNNHEAIDKEMFQYCWDLAQYVKTLKEELENERDNTQDNNGKIRQ